MRSDHDEFQNLVFFDSVGKKVLSSMYFEFMYEDSSQLTTFFLTDFRVIQDNMNLPIKNLLLATKLVV